MSVVPPNVRLELASRPENLLLIRRMFAGLAEAVALDDRTLDDVSTAVSEACNNVVQHAYGDSDGPLMIEVRVAVDAIEAVVCDDGCGLRTPNDDRCGFGKALIQQLTERVEFRGAEGGGTEVRMTFYAPGVHALESHHNGLLPETLPGVDPASTARITLTPARLAQTVLAPLLSAVGARAHFSSAHIFASRLLASALVDGVPVSDEDDWLGVAAAAEPSHLRLCVAPFHAERAERILSEFAARGVGLNVAPASEAGADDGSYSGKLLMLTLMDLG